MITCCRRDKLALLMSQGYERKVAHLALHINACTFPAVVVNFAHIVVVVDLAQFPIAVLARVCSDELTMAQSMLQNPDVLQDLRRAVPVTPVDDIGLMPDDADAKSAGGASAEGEGEHHSNRALHRAKPGEVLVLVNVLHSLRGCALSFLADVLARVEDLSHVLVWARNAAQLSDAQLAAGAQVAVALIELPRLKLKFEPRADPQGVLRLYSLDHADLFISDREDALINQVVEVRSPSCSTNASSPSISFGLWCWFHA